MIAVARGCSEELSAVAISATVMLILCAKSLPAPASRISLDTLGTPWVRVPKLK